MPWSDLQIDALSEQYEAYLDQRGAHEFGPNAIVGFLHEADVTVAELDLVLASNLAQVDLERAWMAWHRGLKSLIDQVSASQALQRFESLPRLASYRTLMGEISTDAAWRELALCELTARDNWGDAIGAAHFLDEYSLNLRSSTPINLHQVFCDIESSHRSSLRPGSTLRGKSQLGRQRSNEGNAGAVTQLPHGNRVVVADSTETKISRIQLTVQLLAPGIAHITNEGRHSMRVTSKTDLNAKQSIVLAFPFVLKIASRRLLFS